MAGPVNGAFSSRANEALELVEAEIADGLVKSAGMSKDEAQAIAVAVGDRLAQTFSGEFIYINKSRATLIRNREIHLAWRRSVAYQALAERYDLTENHIRDIVAMMEAARKAETQVDMFPEALQAAKGSLK